MVANRAIGRSDRFSASPVIPRWQANGWDEPCKSRGLRTVLWTAGGEIPPADPAAYIPYLIAARGADHEAIASGIDHLARDGAHTRSEQRVALLVEHLAAVGFEDTHVADQHGGSLLHRRPVA